MKHIILLFSILFLFGCSQNKTTEPLRMAVAANAQYVAQHLAEAYEAESGQEVLLTVGSSGKLSAQIKEGAPFHVFMSADSTYPAYLVAEQKAIPPLYVYGHGDLAIWSFREDLPIHDPVLALQVNNVRSIAIANPLSAPFGRLTEAWLKEKGVYDSLKSKLIFGESIAQVNQYINSGAADLGITSLSTVMDERVGAKGRWARLSLAPDQLLPQVAVITEYGMKQDKKRSKRLLRFLQSDTAQDILRRYGY